MAQIAKRKLDRMIQARQDYDFGYSQPIFRGDIKNGVEFVESLDQMKVPEKLLEKLTALADIKTVSITIQAISHVWILEAHGGEWMLRKVRQDLHLYDCADTILQKLPSLNQIAEWHDINNTYLHQRASAEKWYPARKLRLEEMEAEVMQAARSESLQDYLSTTKRRLKRLGRMEAVYDDDLDAGKAVVTSRDVLAASGLAHRIQKDLVSLGKDTNNVQNFIQLLISSGLAEPVSDPDFLRAAGDSEVIDAEAVEIIDAEVIEVIDE